MCIHFVADLASSPCFVELRGQVGRGTTQMTDDTCFAKTRPILKHRNLVPDLTEDQLRALKWMQR